MARQESGLFLGGPVKRLFSDKHKSKKLWKVLRQALGDKSGKSKGW